MLRSRDKVGGLDGVEVRRMSSYLLIPSHCSLGIIGTVYTVRTSTRCFGSTPRCRNWHMETCRALFVFQIPPDYRIVK